MATENISKLSLAQSLDELKKNAANEFKTITTMDSLEEWRSRYLDRTTGKLPEIFRAIDKLPVEERLDITQIASEAKENLGWDFGTRFQQLFIGNSQDILNWLRDHALERLETISSISALNEWDTFYLGQRGAVTLALRTVGKIPSEKRKEVGQAANALKVELEQLMEARGQELRAAERLAALDRERLDVTLPGRRPPRGHIHPISQTIRDISRIFSLMGFQTLEGPEVETDYYNFQALNIPVDHPARDMQDTFWVVPGQILLRTQTSNNQIRLMEQMRPPVRAIVPGKVYRHEAIDASHEAMFHQVEGILVDETCTMSDLRGVVSRFAREMFGANRKVRFRPSYFPFTEPSAEFDIDCIVCDGKGCRVCKYSGWLEMGGSGMVDPRVLRGVGYDPAVYRGFAFGLGIERIAMLRYGIDEIRLFYGNDLRFLRQFI